MCNVHKHEHLHISEIMEFDDCSNLTREKSHKRRSKPTLRPQTEIKSYKRRSVTNGDQFFSQKATNGDQFTEKKTLKMKFHFELISVCNFLENYFHIPFLQFFPFHFHSLFHIQYVSFPFLTLSFIFFPLLLSIPFLSFYFRSFPFLFFF